MKHLSILLLLSLGLWSGLLSAQNHTGPAGPTIFAYGGQVNRAFLRHTAALTGKERPRICFLPTATGDRASYINYFYELCADLPVEPHVMRVWISSYSMDQTFEDYLLSMDAIVVGGGNTLNMLAIWQAQGIDTVLQKAYRQGTILAGGSAGSLCWFAGGTTDSRPVQLSTVQGLGLLPFSHCPHYHSEASRKPLYHQHIREGTLADGYAIDDLAGIVFVHGTPSYAVTTNGEDHAYFVWKDGDTIREDPLPEKKID